MKTNSIKIWQQFHPFHMVSSSPWPILTSFSIVTIILNIILFLHYPWNTFRLSFLIFCAIFCIYSWFSDVITEATFEGNHTKAIQSGLKLGMLLFILSEVMFSFAFFWAFFHSSLIPSISIGLQWPPAGIKVLSPWGLPLLNTIILLSSGVSITWAHRCLIVNKYYEAVYGLQVTIGLGILFTLLQLIEYIHAEFSINSGIYGSIFFIATGFHGFHVLVGTCFLIVCLYRQTVFHFTKEHHVGFEAAAWYWHFVDVAWLFLFITIYWWGYSVGSIDYFSANYFLLGNILS
jgi:cytochrome c oxidase subunit 3